MGGAFSFLQLTTRGRLTNFRHTFEQRVSSVFTVCALYDIIKMLSERAAGSDLFLPKSD